MIPKSGIQYRGPTFDISNCFPLKICVTYLFILELTKGKIDCLLTGY